MILGFWSDDLYSSGAMYIGVPASALVSHASETRIESPKSQSFGTLSVSSRRMFSGLMSLFGGLGLGFGGGDVAVWPNMKFEFQFHSNEIRISYTKCEFPAARIGVRDFFWGRCWEMLLFDRIFMPLLRILDSTRRQKWPTRAKGSRHRTRQTTSKKKGIENSPFIRTIHHWLIRRAKEGSVLPTCG